MSYGYREYRNGLPKGVYRQAGDLFIKGDTVYQVIEGPQGDLRLLNLALGLFRPLRCWESTHSMKHIAPGVLLSAGMQTWAIVGVAGETVAINTCPMDDAHPTETMSVYELVVRLRIANDEAEHRAWLCETVELLLKDADLASEDVTMSKDMAGRGLVVGGLKPEALPETLAIAEALAGGCLVIAPAAPKDEKE